MGQQYFFLELPSKASTPHQTQTCDGNLMVLANWNGVSCAQTKRAVVQHGAAWLSLLQCIQEGSLGGLAVRMVALLNVGHLVSAE